MLEDMMAYCVGDIQHLPHFRGLYFRRLAVAWKQKVESETTNRVTDLQTSIYQPHGSHKTLFHDKSKP